MSFTQTTFLGASIRGWTSQLGWGSEPSRISVDLVEDATNGDIFSPVYPGMPVNFAFGDWSFQGLLQNVNYKGGQEGNPLYTVSVIDPRQILDGVQLVLGGYNGTTSGVSNLFNVFGYLENTLGFGSSQRNEAGIPYAQIVNALTRMSTSNGAYGKYISYRGYQYTVDLSNLPPIDAAYRINATNISLMDFIREICTVGGSEDSFFFRLIGNIIKIYCVDRRSNPTLGAISSFIANTEGAVSKGIGLEMRNQTTSKFITGGDVEQIYLVTYDDQGTRNENDDSIWPYWGLDKDWNIIVGTGTGDDHEFTVDSRRINMPGIGPTYTMTVGELRAAIDSQESWETYIANFEPEKAQRLKIISNTINIYDFLSKMIAGANNNEEKVEKIKNINPSEMFNLTKKAAEQNDENDDPDANYIDDYIRIIYDFVRDYASNYYGKKFMVRIPYLYTATESETGNILLSQIPNDSGYLDEDYWSIASSTNLLPEDTDFLTNADNKIGCYVRFDHAENLDLSEISPSDLVFNKVSYGRGGKRNSEGLSVFIKCSVEPDVQFLNYNTKYSPRVIVTLPGAVRTMNENEKSSYNGVFNKILKVFLVEKKLEDSFEEISKEFSSKIGGDSLFYGIFGAALMPDLIGVPLRSKISSYGPWYASGGDGKVEYEKKDDLVPWNFAGFELMNAAGNAAVQDSISGQFISEAGTIEFPGVPSINLGDILIFGGPYVTDVNVAINKEGARTTYSMAIWTPRFGRVPQSMIDRMQRIALGQQRQRKDFLSRKRVQPVDIQRVQRLYRAVNRKSHNSSHGLIVGEVTKDSDRSVVSVFLQSGYNSIPQIHRNYNNKAVASLDSLFVPFSTKTDYSGNLPKMETPTGSSPNIDTLNPYKGEHIATVMSNSDSMPERLSLRPDYVDDDNYRAIALRAPLVLAGWGRDTNNKPVPADPGDSSSYMDGYQVKVENWKVGPLDVRWNNDKKVWTTNSLLQRGKVLDTINISSGSGLVTKQSFYNNTWNDTEEQNYCYIGMPLNGGGIQLNTIVWYTDLDDHKFIILAECS